MHHSAVVIPEDIPDTVLAGDDVDDEMEVDGSLW